MKVSLASRKMTHMRALVWLVDECNGEASVLKLADNLIGDRRGGPTISMIRPLVQNDWARVYEPPKGGVMKGVIKVTPAGYLWRDYLRFEPRYRYLDRIEMHARIRALELAIEPMANVGKRYVEASPAEKTIVVASADGLGISPLQLEIANEVLYGSGERVVYPWTPRP